MGYICVRQNIVETMKNQTLRSQLRSLTLGYNDVDITSNRDLYSGMNSMMNCYNHLIRLNPDVKINAYAVLAYNFISREIPLGWALMHREDGHRFGGYSPAAQLKKELGWMYQVYVNPMERGKGIGKILMNHCCKHFEGDMLVFDDNVPKYFRGEHFEKNKHRINSIWDHIR